MGMNIKSILKKKSWTGEEIGKVFLANAIDGYKRILSGEVDPKPLFSQSQLNAMVESLRDSYDITVYNRYSHLYNWINTSLSLNHGHWQTINSEIRLNVLTLSHINTIERVLIDNARKPKIMTSKEYETMKKNKLESFFTGEDGTDNGITLFELVDNVIYYYSRLELDNPRRKNPVKTILRRYASESIESEYLSSQYGRVTGNGYYILSDGRKSDDLSQDEWENALKDGLLLYNYSKDDLSDVVRKDFYISRLKDEGLSEDEAHKAVKKILQGNNEEAQYRLYEEAPDDLTKREVIDELFIMESYPALMDSEADDKTFRQQLRLLREEFSDLVDAILIDIDETVFNGKTNYSSISIKEWPRETVISYRELYDRNLYGKQDDWNQDHFLFDGEPNPTRHGLNGIAILNASSFKGNDASYEESNTLDEIDTQNGLKQFTPANKDYVGNIALIEESRQSLVSSYRELLIFDTIMDMVDEYLQLENFSIFKSDAEIMKQRTQALDEYKETTKKLVSYSHTDRAEKLRIIDEVFYSINIENITLSDDALKKIERGIFSDLKLFEEKHPNLVRYYKELEGGGAND